MTIEVLATNPLTRLTVALSEYNCGRHLEHRGVPVLGTANECGGSAVSGFQLSRLIDEMIVATDCVGYSSDCHRIAFAFAPPEPAHAPYGGTNLLVEGHFVTRLHIGRDGDQFRVAVNAVKPTRTRHRRGRYPRTRGTECTALKGGGTEEAGIRERN